MDRYCGYITRIFYRKDNFAIAKFRTREEENNPSIELTIVGTLLPDFTEKDLLEIYGVWEDTEKYGAQLKIDTAHRQKPITAHELESYLVNSKDIVGVGPYRTKLLIQRFGDGLIDILDNHPERLTEVKGIGKETAARIAKSWKDHAIDRELGTLLSSIGVGGAWARRIHKELGDDAVNIIKSNPYRLIDVHGIGFKKADEIARRLGYDHNSDERIRAVLFYLLEKAANEGHTHMARGGLIEQAAEECGVPETAARAQLDGVLMDDRPGSTPAIVQEIVETTAGKMPVVFLRRLHRAEKSLAKDLIRLIEGRPYRKFELLHINLAIQMAEKKLEILLNEKQRDAIRMALSNSASVLTGGPGTGKTTALKILIQVAKDLGLRFALAAPTGRAAKRMNEVTGEAASTMHLLLQYSPQDRCFKKDRDDQLDHDLIVFDEMSMVGVSLAEALAAALPTGACILFVGDPNQLPSVEAGRVLDDLLQSGRVPKVELTEIFRQAQKSLIVKNAYSILHGEMPRFFPDPGGKAGPLSYDCYMVEAPVVKGTRRVDGDWVKAMVARLASERVPLKLGLDAVRDVQVLIPQKRGTCGVYEMNRHLQDALNPRTEKDRVQIGGREFRVGDRVMVTKNNYELMVYNGDVGFIRRFDNEDKHFLIDFEDRELVFPFDQADELTLAYASTIHKAQGSEYDVVIVVLLKEHFVSLKRNLLYTATTRAKRLLIFVAQSDAIALAVKHNEVDSRNSLLALRLRARAKRAEAA